MLGTYWWRQEPKREKKMGVKKKAFVTITGNAT